MRGFTLVEIIVSMGILMMLVGISVVSFGSYSKREALYSNVSALATSLRDARSRTLASVGGSQYGVKIDTDRFSFFTGSTFASSTADTPFILSSYLMASTSLRTIVFSRITGNASVSGTIEIYLKSTPTIKKTLTVYSTGFVATQ